MLIETFLQKRACVDYDPGKHRTSSEVHLYANSYFEEHRGEILIAETPLDLSEHQCFLKL